MLTFTTSNVTFTLPTLFAEGHICSPAEADELNRLAKTKLQAKMALLIKSERGDTDLSVSDIAGYKSVLSVWTQEFSFSSPGRGPRGSKDPILAEATKIAKAILESHYRAKGIDPKSLTKEALQGNIEALIAKRPDLTIEEAKKRLHAAASIAAEALEGLV